MAERSANILLNFSRQFSLMEGSRGTCIGARGSGSYRDVMVVGGVTLSSHLTLLVGAVRSKNACPRSRVAVEKSHGELLGSLGFLTNERSCSSAHTLSSWTSSSLWEHMDGEKRTHSKRVEVKVHTQEGKGHVCHYIPSYH